MSCVRIVDTSVFCNLLEVPGCAQDRDRAFAELRAALDAGDSLLLPIATVLETGNHIAQSSDGRMRRQAAERFAEQVRLALEGATPFSPTPLPDAQAIATWIGTFPDRAMEGLGFGDLSIIQVFEAQCELNRARRVLIWAYDAHLSAYDRRP
jgi:hypothetical protein